MRYAAIVISRLLVCGYFGWTLAKYDNVRLANGRSSLVRIALGVALLLVGSTVITIAELPL
jgi:hypothetical protein